MYVSKLCVDFQMVSLGLQSTRTALARNSGSMCGRGAAGGEAILDVLHALGLVGVGEPVLAHVEVVAEADSTASHEDFGHGKRRHGCLCALVSV